MDAPILVACPFPGCDWATQIPLDGDYPSSLVGMLNGNARQYRDQHIIGHGALAWHEAYEKLAAAGCGCYPHPYDHADTCPIYQAAAPTDQED